MSQPDKLAAEIREAVLAVLERHRDDWMPRDRVAGIVLGAVREAIRRRRPRAAKKAGQPG